MKTREDIITSMCYTMRHDFGLDKPPGNGWSSGMSTDERAFLYGQMAQIFDNDIAPLLEDYRRLVEGEAVVVPKDKEHAEALVKMGTFYLETSK
jgi:hypothetical protein